MENYEKADQFLADCKKGKSSFVVIYEVRQDGGINRMKFTYDGIDMYVISTSGIWMKNDIPGIAYTSYTRIKEWEYTENGWFVISCAYRNRQKLRKSRMEARLLE